MKTSLSKKSISPLLLDNMMSNLADQVNMLIPDEILMSPSKSPASGRISKRSRVKPVKLEAAYKARLPSLPDKILDSDSDKEDKI